MLFTFPVSEKRRVASSEHEPDDLYERVQVARSEIPACTHIDDSARVQTVDREHQPRLPRPPRRVRDADRVSRADEHVVQPRRRADRVHTVGRGRLRSARRVGSARARGPAGRARPGIVTATRSGEADRLTAALRVAWPGVVVLTVVALWQAREGSRAIAIASVVALVTIGRCVVVPPGRRAIAVRTCRLGHRAGRVVDVLRGDGAVPGSRALAGRAHRPRGPDRFTEGLGRSGPTSAPGREIPGPQRR